MSSAGRLNHATHEGTRLGSLDDKVVIITGASGGLGRETVRFFLEEGARIAACDVAEVPVAQIARADLRHRCVPVKLDVTSEQGAAELVSHALREFNRVDVLLNLVGGWQGGVPLQKTSIDAWSEMFRLNLKTAFLCSRAVLPHMLQRRAGRIINVSSRTAVMPVANQAAYNAAKAGVIALTQTLAEEVKHEGITVNCVLPSVIDTEANRKAMPTADFPRWVKPVELARVIAFLASDASAPITGAAIPVYGRA